MPGRPQTDFSEVPTPTLFERLAAPGPGMSVLEEQIQIVHVLRSRSQEAGAEVDRWLLGQVNRLREGLFEAREYQAELKEVLEKLSATPWHPAVFLGPVATEGGPSAAVACRGAVRVVGLADGVSLEDLAVGDEVFLGRDLNVVMRKSPSPLIRTGETATFERALDDGRIVLKHRDDEMVVRPAATLDADALGCGDRVRWDRQVALAFEKIPRSHDSGLFLEDTPREGFERIGGLDDQIGRLQRSLRLHLLNADVVRRYGLRRATSALLVGPPGTGKTMIARALANWLGQQARAGRSRFIHIKPSALHSMWYAQSEANYRDAFRIAREAGESDPDTPVVMFFDEIDSVGAARGDVLTRVDDRVLTSFMAELDGLESRGNVLVVAATNRREALDPALLRAGRLGDVVIEVPRPGMSAAAAIFEKHLPEGIPYAGHGDHALTPRRLIIDAAVSRLYAPNGEGDLAALMFRDGARRMVQARDLISGATIANISRIGIEAACQREIDGGEPGVHLCDVLDAIGEELGTAVATLTPANCHRFISGLPQDLAVVRVEPVVRKVRRPHRYVHAA